LFGLLYLVSQFLLLNLEKEIARKNNKKL